MFSIQVIAWTVVVVLEEASYGGHRRPSEIAVAIGLKVGALIAVSIAYTMILLEGVKSFMVIADYLSDKLKERRKAQEARCKAEEEKRISEAVDKVMAEVVPKVATEAMSQGMAEAHQAWADWNRRRVAAEEEDKPFDEAPPEFPQHTGEPQ